MENCMEFVTRLPGTLTRYVNSSSRCLTDQTDGRTQDSFHPADWNVDDVPCRKAQRLLLTVHDFFVGDRHFDHLPIGPMLHHSQGAHFGLQCKTLRKRDSLSYVKFTLFLHRIATRAIHRAEHIDNASFLHDDSVSWMDHNIADFCGISPPGVVVGLGGWVTIRALEFNFSAC